MAIPWKVFYTSYKRIVVESLWIAAGQAVRAIGMLVGIRLLTSVITPAVYGKLSLLVGALALGTGIFCHPFLHAVNRFYHEANRSYSIQVLYDDTRKLLIFSTCVLAVTIITAGSIYTLINQSVPLLTMLFTVILLFAEMFSAYETTFLTAARRQARYSAWVAVECWLKPCCALLIVFAWQPSLNAILIGYSIGIVFTVLLFFRPAVHEQHSNSASSSLERPKRIRQIITFAMPLFPLALVGWVSSLGDRYIIGAMLDYQAVGIYAAAYGLIVQPFLIAGGIVELTIRPIYFKAVTHHETQREKELLICWLILAAIISATGFSVVFTCHQWIAELFLGPEFRQASALMPCIAAGAGLLTIGHVLEKPFYAYMQTRYVLYIQVWGAIISILSCLVLIAAYGLNGAAAAVPIYFGLQCLIAIYFTKKRIYAQI